MPGVHHDRGERGGEDGRAAGDETHAHKLHGPRVDESAHGEGPPEPVARAAQQDAEADAENDIPRHHGDRGDERFAHHAGQGAWSRIVHGIDLRR